MTALNINWLHVSCFWC